MPRADGLRRGAYVLADAPNGEARADPDRERLGGRPDRRGGGAAAGARASRCAACRCRAGSCSTRSRRQYRDAVLPPSVQRAAGGRGGRRRRAGIATSATRGDVLGVDRFGASAPGDVMLREYGFTVDNVCARAQALLAELREMS